MSPDIDSHSILRLIRFCVFIITGYIEIFKSFDILLRKIFILREIWEVLGNTKQ